MSDLNIQRYSGAPNLQPKQLQGAASDPGPSSRTASQKHLPTADLTDDPTDIIVTSPEAGAALNALNAQNNTEAQKEFDAKQLKAAIQQLHLLQILGLGLGPEKLAKQTTDLAKQIAGIAKDYADNSGGTLAGATPSPAASAASEADTAATQANSAATTPATGNDAAGAAKTDADQASQAAKASADKASQAAKVTADKAAQSAQAAAKAAQSASGAATPGAPSPTGAATAPSAASASSTSSATSQTAATDPDKALADSPDGFFAEVTAAFKDLKKLETKALSALNLSPDQQKKKEAKKLGGEFNDAVLSTEQSAAASGVKPGELADQTIDLSKVTINISA